MLNITELNSKINLQPNTVIGYNEILKELMSIQEDICSGKKDEALKKIACLTSRIMGTIEFPTNMPAPKEIYYDKLLDNWNLSGTYNYDCCKNCLNNPANGGSGSCNCALPYMTTSTETWKTHPDVTYSTETSMQVNTGATTKTNETITK